MPSGDDSHPCTNGAAIGLGTNAFDLQPVVFRATIIAKERRRLVHINDGDVHVAVVVEVPEGGPTAAVRLSYSQPGARGNIYKAASPEVLVNNLSLLEGNVYPPGVYFGEDV